MRLYTFVLRYGDDYGDEIDVEANNASEALRLATVAANDLYDSGWTELQPIQAGGSGGLVVIL